MKAQLIAVATVGAVAVSLIQLGQSVKQLLKARAETKQLIADRGQRIKDAQARTEQVRLETEAMMAETDRRRAADQSEHEAKMAELTASMVELVAMAEHDNQILDRLTEGGFTVAEAMALLKTPSMKTDSNKTRRWPPVNHLKPARNA